MLKVIGIREILFGWEIDFVGESEGFTEVFLRNVQKEYCPFFVGELVRPSEIGA